MNATTGARAVKMHGAENVFVVLDERTAAPQHDEVYAARARALCAPDGPMDGADGLLIIGDAPAALARMRIFNADGGEAEMCGNGVRCVARYLRDRGASDAFAIATFAGAIGVEIVRDDPFAARLDMGAVRFAHDGIAETFDALGTTWTYHDVSVGNPHAVVFVAPGELDGIDLEALGRAAQRDARFVAGTNLHLVAVAGPRRLRVRHYERGAGVTRACGTGAVASAAAAISLRGVASPVAVDVPGGRLDVAWGPGTNASLTGPAETLFERTLPV